MSIKIPAVIVLLANKSISMQSLIRFATLQASKKKRIVTTKCKSAPNQTIAKRKKPENDLLNPILFPVVFSLAVPVALHGFHAAHCTVHNTLRLNTGITADIGATA